MLPKRIAPLLLGALTAIGCGSSAEQGSADESAETAGQGLQMCAAVRGNGESILTHFASLSHVIEHYGVIDGMAGGSSGSITTFTYESILKNEAIRTCGGQKCSRDADAARVALAVKSVQGYADAVSDSDEVNSVKRLAATAQKIQADVAEKKIDTVTDSAEAAKLLQDVLAVPELRAMINPEIFTMLEDGPLLQFNVQEIMASIKTLGAFSVPDNRLFFRTSVLAWPELANLFGRVGDFYAGYGPVDGTRMSAWLDACAEPTRDKAWVDAAQVPMASGGTCGSELTGMVTEYRAKIRSGAKGAKSRLDERVGAADSPLRKVISTAVLEGANIAKYKEARAKYRSGAYPTGAIPFESSFDDMRFGYWGSDADLATVSENRSGFDDLKTKKMSKLGNATWREILAASPAEPGLSPFVELPDGRFSAGGWSDLAPVLVLKNLGCKQVIYIQRAGDESKFAAMIAQQTGMSEQNWKSLYDLSSADSSYSRSVASADGVWCTRWNDFEDSQMAAEVLDSYNSPLEARSTLLPSPIRRPYSALTERTDRVGCTPGKSGGATFPK